MKNKKEFITNGMLAKLNQVELTEGSSVRLGSASGMDDKVEEWASTGCRSVATVVAAARSLPQTAFVPSSNKNPLTGYRKVSCNLQRRVCHLIDRLWSSPLESLSQLETANDVLLERLEHNLSKLEGRPAPPSVAPQISQALSNVVSPQPIRLIQPIRQNQASKSRVVRPQLLFKDPIDNTNTPWKPTIKIKHNSVVPLNIEPVVDERGKVCEYVHPYAVEIDAYKPPAKFINSDLTPVIELKDFNQTPLKFIDTEPELKKLVEHINTVSEVAVDLEHHSYRSFQGFTCLIQISTELGGDFIIDALTLRDCLHSLNDPFTNPNILKVFHGADSDVIWLQRDFGVYIVGLFDTHKAAMKLGFSNKSLKNLLWKYCKKATDKSFQLADWRVRPLPENLCEYARGDTHSLLYIWRCMRKELLEVDNGNTNRLLSVFEDSKVVCSKQYVKPKLDEMSANELIRKSGKYFNSRQRLALNSLLTWRDDIARQEDESTGYVLPNHMILQIAEILPKETAGILACCLPTPPLVLHHLNTIYQMITSARTKPLVVEKPEATIEDIIKPVKSIQIYNHQYLEPTSKNTNVAEAIRELKKLKMPSSKSCLFSSNEIEVNKTVEDISYFRFVPPFHRLLLVKKYNEITGKNDVLIKDSNKPSNDSIELESTVMTPKNAQSDSEVIIIDEPSNKTNDSHIVFNSKNFNSKHEKNSTVNKTAESTSNKTPGKRGIDKNDDNFKPFDYKSYNYNSFNKHSFQHKKKRKKT